MDMISQSFNGAFFGMIALAFIGYFIFFFVMIVVSAWIFARAFRVKERSELLREQNALLGQILRKGKESGE